jgi:hypothetical protein
LLPYVKPSRIGEGSETSMPGEQEPTVESLDEAVDHVRGPASYDACTLAEALAR